MSKDTIENFPSIVGSGLPWITDHVVMADFLAVVPKAPQKELQPHGVLDDDDARPRSFIVNVPSAGFFRLE